MKRTLYPWERGVRFDRGVLVGELGPGRHRMRMRTVLTRVDVRSRTMTPAAQDVPTADGVLVRVTVVVRWTVTSPTKFVMESAEPESDLYTAVQQHAAFSWFVHAQTLQRGVLAAGLAAPAHLKLREDLRTRLGWGHVFQLQVLSEPERRAVLRQAADARGVFLGDDVMDFILTRFSRDLGSLMQLLDHLDAYALQTKRAITIPLVKSMLENE